MTLPSSGSITMAQIAAELGISATGLNLNDSRVRALAGKSSGAISFADLRGKSNGAPAGNLNVSTSYVGKLPSSGAARVQFNSDGSIQSDEGYNGWYVPNNASAGAKYWIKFKKVSGTASISGAAVNTLYPLTSARWVQITRSTAGTANWSGTYWIYSNAAGTVQVATGSISLSVSLEN